MIGDVHFDGLLRSAPVNFDEAKVDWVGYRALLEEQSVDPGSVLAVTWCKFGTWNIEAAVDPSSLTIVHPGGNPLLRRKAQYLW